MNKPPLLMIAGHLCDERIFSDLTPRLESAAEILLAAPPDASSIEEMAERLLAEAPERFAVAGYSLGGMIAMSMVDQAPERLLGAAFIASDPLAAREKEVLYRDGMLEAAGMYSPASYADALVAQFFVHKPSVAALIGPDLREMAIDAAPGRMVSEARALSHRPNQIDALASYSGPVATIVGASDRICPPRLSKTITDACRNGSLTEIADVGHMAPLEASVEVGEALQGWVARIVAAEA
ncbi:MAG: alpha/beta hydrolase [Neomegalonema sp.]|nr:alpha/beta hydrolase [Neomegalonema sp.]